MHTTWLYELSSIFRFLHQWLPKTYVRWNTPYHVNMSTRCYIHISARHNTCVEISHGVSLYESSCLVLPQRRGECRTSCTHLMKMDIWEGYHLPQMMLKSFASVCLNPGNVIHFQVRVSICTAHFAANGVTPLGAKPFQAHQWSNSSSKNIQGWWTFVTIPYREGIAKDCCFKCIASIWYVIIHNEA